MILTTVLLLGGALRAQADTDSRVNSLKQPRNNQMPPRRLMRPSARYVGCQRLPTAKIIQDALMPTRTSIWVAILIGSTIGGAIPELWGAEMLSYTSLLLSGIGALVGLWISFRM
jgi:uncharacterized membrane protein YeaQ/YmgE (transglycosylase-associated protein family)